MTTSYVDPRTEMVQFLPETAVRVLDVGCSTGEFGRSLRAQHSLKRLVGIEPNATASAEAREVYDEVATGLFPEDLPASLAGEEYDAIYFNDVLEHMVEPAAALDAARGLLAPDGVLIASIPNVRHISVLGPLIVRDEFKYKPSGILDATHLRFFTGRSIRRLFDECGWTIDRIESVNRGLFAGDSKNRLWIRWLGRATGGLTDGFFTVQYAVVARPRG